MGLYMWKYNCLLYFMKVTNTRSSLVVCYIKYFEPPCNFNAIFDRYGIYKTSEIGLYSRTKLQ